MEKPHSMELPLVTCIILSYKKFEFLPDALHSVLHQTYPKIELLITDDASPGFDEFRNQLETMIEREKRDNILRCEIHHHPENVGTVKNINSMLRIASGEYYFLLSGDDEFYDETVVSAVVDRFLETGADFLSCSRMYCTNAMKPVKVLPTRQDLRMIRKMNTAQKQFRSFAVFQYHNIASGSAMYYSKRHFVEFGLFDESYRLWEDGPRLAKYTQAGRMIETAFDIVAIRYRGGGISNLAPGSSAEKIRLGKDHLRYISKVLIPNKAGTNLRLRRYWMFWYFWDTSENAAKRRSLLLRYPEYIFKFLWRKIQGKPIR